MNIKIGDKVVVGKGGGMSIGTVTEIQEPVAPYYITHVKLENIVTQKGVPSKKHKNGIWVNIDGIKEILESL